jgi:peptidoglycan/LPS O-acetylase OafA/YrhL
LAVARHYLPTLDGWRAVAILAVICCHAGWPNATVAPYGAMGVSVFFALSGFLIMRRLMDEGDIDLRGFYRRRAFRILPPILVYLAVIALVLRVDRGQLPASLFFYRNYLTLPASSGWYTGHFWSLAIEEHFYLLWPALLYFAGFRRARWMAPVLVLAVAVWRAADMHYDWIGRFQPGLRGWLGRTDYRLDTLLCGCALALWWDVVPFRRIGGTALAIAAAVAAVCCQIWTPPGYLTIVAVLMALLPAATVARPESWAGRLLEWPLLAWIGRLSYSLYIWQQLFLPPESSGIWRMPAIFLCAAISYYCVERPCIALGRDWPPRHPDRVKIKGKGLYAANR